MLGDPNLVYCMVDGDWWNHGVIEIHIGALLYSTS